MKQLLVIGGASIDILHLIDHTVTCAGGAGMYTAMAAHRCGVNVTMFSPRPELYPDELEPIVKRVTDWLGPVVPLEQLPHFEISYRQGKTEYLEASFGAEGKLSPTMLPADLSKYDHVHVIPIADPSTQLSFIRACRQRGAKRISAGTWPGIAVEQPQAVCSVMDQTDYFFLNDLEAKALFGSLESVNTRPGQILFVTLGEQGACIIQGDTSTLIPAVPTTEFDPTGAGDTFCGATLAHLMQGVHPIMAAHQAVALAAEMITQVGPSALLFDEPPPKNPQDARVQVNHSRVQKVAEKLSTLSELAPFPFVGPQYPPVGHPKALEYFFAATLQQFSFWSERNNRYVLPMMARIGGVEWKGSDYLWEAFRRRVEQEIDFCSPGRQANLSRDELLEVFRADNGEDPMPALDLHLKQMHSYGRDMLALQLAPQVVVDHALASTQPLQTFLVMLDQIGGYKEDPLRKKSLLLAMILNDRPENFLPLRDDAQVKPPIDYHLLRSCLRVGLIDVIDEDLKNKLCNRLIVLSAEEWAVRYSAYCAFEKILALSGKSLGAVNQFFFRARTYCPEMSEPECELCQLDPVCAHRKELFQPVLRTTLY